MTDVRNKDNSTHSSTQTSEFVESLVRDHVYEAVIIDDDMQTIDVEPRTDTNESISISFQSPVFGSVLVAKN